MNNTYPQYPPEVRKVSCGYLILDRFATSLRDQAVQAFEAGDATLFLGLADNMRGLCIVEDNYPTLVARGIFERALLIALVSPRTNLAGWSNRRIRALLSRADRPRLRQAGDPLPGTGPFTLHRGVSGTGPRRRVRGFSWTSDLEKAHWFALRYAQELGRPTLIHAEFEEPEILAYLNERNEREFIVDPIGKKVKVESLRPAL